ncbi:MAG: hypothetical protein RLZZ242_473 [Bacteroidota bacterium]|jgi:hypothetical protein
MIKASMTAFIVFFALTTALVILGLYLLKRKKRMSYLGPVYLGTMLLKMVLFGLIFYPFLVDLEFMSKLERAQPLIPLFATLFLEVVAVNKMLKDS